MKLHNVLSGKVLKKILKEIGPSCCKFLGFNSLSEHPVKYNGGDVNKIATEMIFAGIISKNPSKQHIKKGKQSIDGKIADLDKSKMAVW